MTEEQFQQQVIDYARLNRWRVLHIRPARTKTGWATPIQADGKGYPDLTLCRKGELLFAELKGDTGQMRPEQLEWLTALAEAGQEVAVWRPSDWDEVEARLGRPRL